MTYKDMPVYTKEYVAVVEFRKKCSNGKWMPWVVCNSKASAEQSVRDFTKDYVGKRKEFRAVRYIREE